MADDSHRDDSPAGSAAEHTESSVGVARSETLNHSCSAMPPRACEPEHGRDCAASPSDIRPLWQFRGTCRDEDVGPTDDPSSGLFTGDKRTMPSKEHGKPFDPRGAQGQRNIYNAPPEVNDYLETHFRRVLPDDERREMQSVHPRPNTDVLHATGG